MDSRCKATIGRVSNPNCGTRIIYIYIYIYGVLGGWGGGGRLWLFDSLCKNFDPSKTQYA